jgi:3-oxoadipate enol-lactonase
MTTVSTVLGPIYVDDQGRAGEPVALLWPSLFTDRRMWDDQVAALRTAGWRTLALDPPGHGQSPGPGHAFKMDECAEAAVQVLDGVGVSTAVVALGTSWGGMIVPRIALRAPDRVRGMVLFNTTAESARPFERVRNTLLTKMLAIHVLDTMVDRMLVSLQLAPETRRRNPDLGVQICKTFRSWERRRVIDSVKSVLVDRDSILEALRHVSAPALVVSGKEDSILPSGLSRRIAQQLPKARHVEVAGAAHLVPVETPDASNRLILDFVDSLKH